MPLAIGVIPGVADRSNDVVLSTTHVVGVIVASSQRATLPVVGLCPHSAYVAG
jgi:hypothetical protein